MSLAAIEFRPARVTEVDAILGLERTIEMAPHWSRAEYLKYFEEQESLKRGLFVALHGNDVVGFAGASVIGDEGEVETIAVRLNDQGHGIGARLLQVLLAWSKATGALSMHLEVRARGGAARRLYQSFGFNEMGRRSGYYDEPADDAVVMSRAESGKTAGEV